jgi:hypothetical protein
MKDNNLEATKASLKEALNNEKFLTAHISITSDIQQAIGDFCRAVDDANDVKALNNAILGLILGNVDMTDKKKELQNIVESVDLPKVAEVEILGNQTRTRRQAWGDSQQSEISAAAPVARSELTYDQPVVSSQATPLFSLSQRVPNPGVNTDVDVAPTTLKPEEKDGEPVQQEGAEVRIDVTPAEQDSQEWHLSSPEQRGERGSDYNSIEATLVNVVPKPTEEKGKQFATSTSEAANLHNNRSQQPSRVIPKDRGGSQLKDKDGRPITNIPVASGVAAIIEQLYADQSANKLNQNGEQRSNINHEEKINITERTAAQAEPLLHGRVGDGVGPAVDAATKNNQRAEVPGIGGITATQSEALQSAGQPIIAAANAPDVLTAQAKAAVEPASVENVTLTAIASTIASTVGSVGKVADPVVPNLDAFTTNNPPGATISSIISGDGSQRASTTPVNATTTIPDQAAINNTTTPTASNQLHTGATNLGVDGTEQIIRNVGEFSSLSATSSPSTDEKHTAVGNESSNNIGISRLLREPTQEQEPYYEIGSLFDEVENPTLESPATPSVDTMPEEAQNNLFGEAAARPNTPPASNGPLFKEGTRKVFVPTTPKKKFVPTETLDLTGVDVDAINAFLANEIENNKKALKVDVIVTDLDKLPIAEFESLYQRARKDIAAHIADTKFDVPKRIDQLEAEVSQQNGYNTIKPSVTKDNKGEVRVYKDKDGNSVTLRFTNDKVIIEDIKGKFSGNIKTKMTMPDGRVVEDSILVNEGKVVEACLGDPQGKTLSFGVSDKIDQDQTKAIADKVVEAANEQWGKDKTDLSKSNLVAQELKRTTPLKANSKHQEKWQTNGQQVPQSKATETQTQSNKGNSTLEEKHSTNGSVQPVKDPLVPTLTVSPEKMKEEIRTKGGLNLGGNKGVQQTSNITPSMTLKATQQQVVESAGRGG